MGGVSGHKSLLFLISSEVNTVFPLPEGPATIILEGYLNLKGSISRAIEEWVSWRPECVALRKEVLSVYQSQVIYSA